MPQFPGSVTKASGAAARRAVDAVDPSAAADEEATILAGLQSQVANLEGQVANLEGQVESLLAKVEAWREEMDAIRQLVDTVQAAVAQLSDSRSAG